MVVIAMPYSKTNPGDNPMCPSCGSFKTNFHDMQEFSYTAWFNEYQCMDCGANFNIIYPKEYN